VSISIPIPFPYSVEHDPVQNAAWIGSSTGFLGKYDAISGAPIGGPIPVDSDVYKIAYDATQNYVWIIDRGASFYRRYNAITSIEIGVKQAIPSLPLDIEYDIFNNNIWILSDQYLNRVNAITGNYIGGSVSTPNFSAGALSYDITQNLVWMAKTDLRAFNPISNTWAAIIPMASSHANGITYDITQNAVWVICQNVAPFLNVMQKFDASTGLQIGSNISFGPNVPTAIAYDQTNNQVLVTFDLVMDKFDAASGAFIASEVIGSQPSDVTYDPIQNAAWVANLNSSTVQRINFAAPPSKKIYLSQKTNRHVVKRLDNTYTHDLTFGTYGIAKLDNTGLNFSSGIASDSTDIYVCDKNNKRIIKLDSSLNYDSQLDVSSEIGEPFAILWDTINSVLYVTGVYKDRSISIARINSSLIVEKYNTDVYLMEPGNNPLGICRGFLSSDFVISGFENLLRVAEMSTYFDDATTQIITGEEDSRFKGNIKHSNGDLYLIAERRTKVSQLIRVESGYVNVGDSDILSKTGFGISKGLNNTILLFNAEDKKIERYNEKLNLIEDIFVDSGDTVSTDCEEIYGIVEILA